MPKHVSNIIELAPGEEVVASIPAYDFTSNINLILTTKNGLIKRTKLSDFKLQRYNKVTSCMKLKDNDELISVIEEKSESVFLTTNTGYGLSFKVSEIPVVGSKAAGVKAMKLKDEFIAILTTKGTGKRVRLSEFEESSRARRGIQVIRDVKSNPYQILKTFIEDSRQYIGLKNQDINTIKLTELPITDRHSIGSQISKHELSDAFVVASLKRKKFAQDEIITDDQKAEEVKVPKKDTINLDEIDDRLMTIDDFLR